jgi:thioredoxin-like negative regulator of GroEL
MKLLRFTASWCQPCKALAKNLEGADLGVEIEVIDIDEQTELAVKYGIRSVPTLVLVGGPVDKRIVGVRTTKQIQEWINE